MSDRTVPYYYQEVTHGEVDQWHDQLEAADRAIVADQAIFGVVPESPFAVTEHAPANFLVIVTGGLAYDDQGRRLDQDSVGSTDVNCAVDHLGAPTVVVGAGNENGLSLYAVFTTADSDPRVDGDGIPLNYLIEEAVAFEIRQSGEAAPPATFPGVFTGRVKLAEITLTFGLAAILNANISTANQEFGGPRRYHDLTSGTPLVCPGLAAISSSTAGVLDFSHLAMAGFPAQVRDMPPHGQPAYLKYPLTKLPDDAVITRIRVVGTQDGPDPGGGGDVSVALYSAPDGFGPVIEAGPWTTGLGAGGGFFTINQVLGTPIAVDNAREYWIEIRCLNQVGIWGDLIVSARAWYEGRILLPGG